MELVCCKPNLVGLLIFAHQHLIMVDDDVDPFAIFQTWVGKAEGLFVNYRHKQMGLRECRCSYMGKGDIQP